MAIEANVGWTLNGVTGTGSPDIDGPASSGFVDVIGSDVDGGGNNIFYHTYGSTSGTFGSRVSGGGTYDIDGIFTFEETYTAAGGPASFSFHIIPGQLDARQFYGPAASDMPAGESVVSGYEIDIRLDGSSIWGSGGEVSVSDAGTASSFTGTSIGGSLTVDPAGTWINYGWPDFFGSVLLGSFAPGATFLLEYDLRTYSYANTSATACAGGGDGGDPTKPELPDGEHENSGNGCGAGIAQSGDPFDLGQGSSGSVSGVVPTPTTAAIFGLGLFGLGAVRRMRGRRIGVLGQ